MKRDKNHNGELNADGRNPRKRKNGFRRRDWREKFKKIEQLIEKNKLKEAEKLLNMSLRKNVVDTVFRKYTNESPLYQTECTRLYCKLMDYKKSETFMRSHNDEI